MELQDLVDEVSRVLGGPATLEDRALRLLAYAPHATPLDAVRQASILRREASPAVRRHFQRYGIDRAVAPVRIPADPEAGVLGRICVPVRQGSVIRGFLWVLDEGQEIDERRLRPLVERLAVLLAGEARDRAGQGRLVRDLLTGPEEARAAAGDRLVDLRLLVPGRHYQVAVAAPSAPLGEGAAALGWVGEDATALILREGETVAAGGIGGVRTQPHELAESWREARDAAEVARVVPSFRPVARWSELGVYRTLIRLRDADLRGAVAGPVRRLLDAGDLELIHTVETFLDRAGHVQESARELSIHRQTLYYRLEKVSRITGLDLDDGRARLELHLALKAAHLVDR
ncbi:PucR family transcriptional regulator [Rhizohabitans arisaemae]|uniref:PucR family transcriptional regulator n=1 Tax=Rhizohabitans arisaemae TaxID=2720610 RepID=UPI0024B0B895|nr:helix-turn-helix domain-containing protein [Rhizohabitans arisaemae]